MKLRDISATQTEPDKGPGEADESNALRCIEILELLKARHADSLFNCMLLAGDELELASHVIAKTYADPCYQPSMTIMQAIRAINAKLALCGMDSTPESRGNRNH